VRAGPGCTGVWQFVSFGNDGRAGPQDVRGALLKSLVRQGAKRVLSDIACSPMWLANGYSHVVGLVVNVGLRSRECPVTPELIDAVRSYLLGKWTSGELIDACITKGVASDIPHLITVLDPWSLDSLDEVSEVDPDELVFFGSGTSGYWEWRPSDRDKAFLIAWRKARATTPKIRPPPIPSLAGLQGMVLSCCAEKPSELGGICVSLGLGESARGKPERIVARLVSSGYLCESEGGVYRTSSLGLEMLERDRREREAYDAFRSKHERSTEEVLEKLASLASLSRDS